ncbi:MAG: hypothetical protein QME51_01050 [Planctomycetota bacterium]|nr:hypothetical protein [Planctomycetota bacterium]
MMLNARTTMISGLKPIKIRIILKTLTYLSSFMIVYKCDFESRFSGTN